MGEVKSGLWLETASPEDGACNRSHTSGSALRQSLNIKMILPIWFEISFLLQALKSAPCSSNKWKKVKYNVIFIVCISWCCASLLIMVEAPSQIKRGIKFIALELL